VTRSSATPQRSIPDAVGLKCDELVGQGGFVFQNQVTPALHTALGIDSEPIPAAATAVARRTIPEIFGFGLLDAVPDSEILAYADPEDRNHDGISGRPNRFSTPSGAVRTQGSGAGPARVQRRAFGAEQGITTPPSRPRKPLRERHCRRAPTRRQIPS